ncbi:hypothetical protein [Rugamonas apoptosis]|uniref:Uncharacterized protein n=1 Tax=Rugamonas apoptosis TaxID=2758570 RepID=A0A7W2F9D6_9BURK|nr:hypothetical protein [Rugamonas apoptosis]MBA5687414.1 hypothetical protein [Rugamonas apoptosis]
MVELFRIALSYLPNSHGGSTVITTDALSSLYSMPNIPGAADTLAQTIAYWFGQTLRHDGFAARHGLAHERLSCVAVAGSPWQLVVHYDGACSATCEAYRQHCQSGLSSLLTHGADAFFNTIPSLQAAGTWDPYSRQPDCPPTYRPWRPFLGLGLPLVNQKSVQFFHYPPVRLLEGTRDYLVDPVPSRWEHLLWVNGVERDTLALYESVLDCAPIAAEDDQGSGPHAGIPAVLDNFSRYQRDQLRALLAATDGAVTLPVVAYGGKAVPQFNKVFNTALPTNGQGAIVTDKVIAGRKTAVLATGHPYNFYYQAQEKDSNDPAHFYVGCGRLRPAVSVPNSAAREAVLFIAAQDLAAARWQIKMAANPAGDAAAVFDACRHACGISKAGATWSVPADSPLRPLLEYLVDYHGSLCYPHYQDPDQQQALLYQFRTPWPEMRHPLPAV